MAAITERLNAMEKQRDVDTLRLHALEAWAKDLQGIVVNNTAMTAETRDAALLIKQAVEGAGALWAFLARWAGRIKRWSYATAKWTTVIAGAVTAVAAAAKAVGGVDIIAWGIGLWRNK